MRRLHVPIHLLVATLCALAPGSASASDSAHATLRVSADFSSRTSLQVSARVLRFEVIDPAQPAIATVDFSAGARTAEGAEVLLVVEPTQHVHGPGGAADVESRVSICADGAGLTSGPIRGASPTVVGRWAGSGLRSGRLTFSLRAAAPGTYTLPVRFALTAP